MPWSKFSTPRWDAGVRYWPGAVMIGSFLPLFVGLNIAFGFSNGPLLTAAVIASYPILLILAPRRKRLVPREVGAATSPVPLRLWVLGFFLFAAATASYSLLFNFGISSGSLARVQVRADRVVTHDREPADEFLCFPVVSRHVVDPDDGTP